MEEQIREDLRRIFRALVIHSPQEFTFAGRRLSAPPVVAPQVPGAPNAQQSLTAALFPALYTHCYSHRFEGTLVPDAQATLVNDPTDTLVRELSQANSGQERLDPLWKVDAVDATGFVWLSRYGSRRIVLPWQIRSATGEQLPAQVGATVNLFFGRESATTSPGFYMVYGETIGDAQDDPGLVRFYWNVNVEGAVPLTREITRVFNRHQVPFQFKSLQQRGWYNRSDAAVLYVARRYFDIASRLVKEVLTTVEPFLKPETPLFSKVLHPGLGFAEDPLNGDSFGMSRCRLVADAIWNTYIKGEQTEEARLAETARLFTLSGLSLNRPYLNAGSVDTYELVSRNN